MIHLLADLHLAPGDALTPVFVRYLDGLAREADAVYLLGDIFNVWVGDDLSLPEHPQAVAALRRLTADNVPVYVMRGNRDFLLGDAFCKATGTQMLADPCTVELAGVKTVLTHGDRYCTADAGYQAYRRFVHNAWAQRAYYGLPSGWRQGIADRLRNRSAKHTSGKRPEITDVTYAAVDAEAEKLGVARIIHGHTHRPALHRRTLGGNGAVLEHWVLPDWRAGSDCKLLALDTTKPQEPATINLLASAAA
ncbi:UDP-2,3-diacylglucosamine diphosphatase [bacterium]|nr:UDP-2,3-diacylglucosamine diphosphatase [bacterium]